ncbi:hypothetical protein Bbelb_395480 [Branchiostoma belcheri]|nr:hypothetical protein Bbelb_395480 [Branchiostoma belcheri]
MTHVALLCVVTTHALPVTRILVDPPYEFCFHNPCFTGHCSSRVDGFNCTCDAGWEGDICDTDIDECFLGNNNCAPQATCTNTAGSFTCTCNTGYTGDRVTCADENECNTKPIPVTNKPHAQTWILTVHRLDAMRYQWPRPGRETDRGHRPIRRPARARSRQACHDTLQTRLTNSQKQLIERGKTVFSADFYKDHPDVGLGDR